MRQRADSIDGDARPGGSGGGTITPVSLASRRGVRLAGLLHLPVGASVATGLPAVVLCHGMESTKEGAKHQALAARLTACGYACLRFDFSYVGESEGSFEDLTISGEVDDLAGACEFLWGSGITALGLVGSSLGGAVAVLFAGSEPRVGALVTIAAVSRPLGIAERMGVEAVADWQRRGYRSEGGGRLKRDFLDDLARVDVLTAARRVKAATLVTHGDQDQVVPVDDALALHDALPQPKALFLATGCDHRFSDPAHLAMLLTRTVDWMVAHLPPVRAGDICPVQAPMADTESRSEPGSSKGSSRR